MEKCKVVRFWMETSDDNWDTAMKLFETKKYVDTLFFAHLAIEKIIKALHYSQKEGHPLPIHKLNKLAQDAGFEFNDEEGAQLEEITRFNISARYDDYKRSFYKLATQEYTKEWLQKADKLRLKIKDFIKI